MRDGVVSFVSIVATEKANRMIRPGCPRRFRIAPRRGHPEKRLPFGFFSLLKLRPRQEKTSEGLRIPSFESETALPGFEGKLRDDRC